MSATESSHDSYAVMHGISILLAEEALTGFGVTNISSRQSLTTFRAANTPRQFSAADREIPRQYLNPQAVYSDTDFERRFRMPRAVFESIQNGIWERGLFGERKDALNKPGISPILRIVAALRLLAYGKSFDEVDEICEMSASSARESFYGFVEEGIRCFGDKCLRVPNEEDLKRILGINV